MAAKDFKEVFARGKSGVEDFNGKALRTQMRREVENTQRRIGLHDPRLLEVLIEEIAVG